MKVINDLYDYENLKIVQDTEIFKFSIDSILLAEFVEIKNSSQVILDLCTGNGVIPLILSYYVKNKIMAFELQDYVFDLARESIEMNGLNEQISCINDDVKNIGKYFPGNNFSVIVANPPYFKYKKSSLINENETKAMARHEIALNLVELFEVVKYALKDKGEFYLVHLPERLEEILYLCEIYGINAKKVQFIYTKSDKNASIVLVKCVKVAKNALKVMPPIFINDYESYKKIFRR